MNRTGFSTLITREIFRFVILSRQTIFPPLITTLLFILIFGYSLGSRIDQIDGFKYVTYILPGLAQMGLITSAFSHSSFSIFMAKFERSIENFLVAPLHYLEIVVAFIVGGLCRGFTVGAMSLLVAVFFVDFPLPHPGLLIVSWLASGIFFASAGVIVGTLATNWDHLQTANNFVLTPLIYLGGSFYSVRMLPEFWQNISELNPIYYSIDLTRYSILGISDLNPWTSLACLAVFGVITITVAVVLFRRGVNLIN